MAVRGYVLIEAEVGKAKGVAESVAKLERSDARVMYVDTVPGPYDGIAEIEAEELDRLGTCITEGIQRVEGVQRTTTCLAVRLS